MMSRHGGWSGRFGKASLGTKLALVGALLGAVVVGGAFVVLRFSIEQNVRRVFVNELQASQRALRQIEEHNRQILVQRALLVSTSPQFRAAFGAWRNDAGTGDAGVQRLATIQEAVQDAFDGSDADFLLITDDSGRTVTSVSRSGSRSGAVSLASVPAVHSALFGATDSPDSALGVLTIGGALLESAAVPILEGGFPVGAVVLGERINRFVPIDPGMASGEIVASDEQVLASSLAGAPAGSSWNPSWLRVGDNQHDLIVAGEEYVTATLPLGSGENARPVDLYLVRSLSAAVDPIRVALTQRFVAAGFLAVLLIGVGGVVLSRTTLRPLSRFVAFMQSGTGSDGYARFADPRAPPEVTALTDSYNRLIESLRLGHEQLQQRTVDLAEVNQRLERQVSQRERAEQALRESEEQLRQAQKLEALGALAGGVAHDFNNILSIILGYAEIVQGELPAGSTHRADVAKITDAAVRARTLVRQLLAFSRKQVLQPQVLDFNQVVENVVPLLRPLIGEDVELEVKLAPDLSRVTADPGQIEQVIMNLAVNARDAMPDGGRLLIETANIQLEGPSEHQPLPRGPVVMLAVSDTGIGMDVATRRRIFEPFFTTKPVGKGTGLGLATVYGIVRQSEGNITVFSEPGKGSAFRCYFPPIGAAEVQEPVASSVPAPAHGAESILIAEDEAELRELMSRALVRQGYTVLTAADGAAALEVAAKHPGALHLLVTDVIMPQVSGPELARRLATERPGLRTIFISGYSDEAIERHGVLAPDSVFLEKPVTPEALTRAVRELLDAEMAGESR
jgi:signal transduction histidine kinase/CheY-like chemotaxis protein